MIFKDIDSNVDETVNNDVETSVSITLSLSVKNEKERKVLMDVMKNWLSATYDD